MGNVPGNPPIPAPALLLLPGDPAKGESIPAPGRGTARPGPEAGFFRAHPGLTGEMWRRLIAVLMIAAGLGLCGFAVRHYWRGWRAQADGRRVLAEREASAKALHSGPAAPPASPAPSPEPGGILSLAPPGSPAPPAEMAAAASGTPPPAGQLPDDTGAKGSIPPGYPYGQPIARLKIPNARIDVVVFGGADAETLEKGPGHIPGTELPGETSAWNNCVISGHRDSHFRHLGWLREGARIDLETPRGNQRYRVISREIVRPDAVRVMQATASPRLTLITCYPFDYIGPAPKRLVLVAMPEESRRR